MKFEYKAVGAPERGKRRKGAKSRSDRAAVAVEQVIAAEAVDGWEYLRTDHFPVEERSGWLARARITERAVMIFRRALTGQGGTIDLERRLEALTREKERQAVAAEPAVLNGNSNGRAEELEDATVAASASEPFVQMPKPAAKTGD